jgi:hypothetical protein
MTTEIDLYVWKGVFSPVNFCSFNTLIYPSKKYNIDKGDQSGIVNILTMFKLYRSDKFFLGEETRLPGENHRPAEVTNKLYHCCIEYTSPEWDSNSQR